MKTENYYAAITGSWQKSRQLITLGIISFLLVLPVASKAATPWYSQGRDHILTLTEDGRVWALGDNSYGQLGNGTVEGKTLEPQMIVGLDGVVAALAGGNHSVALKKDGSVWTWGSNTSGQLGNGTKLNSPVPHKVAGIDNVKAIATGSGHIVALKQDGTVWSWGGNHSGQVGNGKFQDCITPTQASGLRDVTAIVAGAFNTSAIKKDGTLWSWGFNGKGQLGNGGNERSGTPIQIADMNGVHAIAAGDWHMVALKHDGTVWAWGSNHANQLGKTSVAFSFSPVQVPGIHDVTDIIASVGHTIAITKNETVWAWGDAGTGQWGNGTSLEGSVSPVQVFGYNGPVTVAAVVNPGTVLKEEKTYSAPIALADGSYDTSRESNRSEVLVFASR